MKVKYVSILSILIFMCACNSDINLGDTNNVMSDTVVNAKDFSEGVSVDSNNPKEYLGEIYSVALDSIMDQDSGLNNGIKYIAIDMSNFNELTENDKEIILSYFKEKYKVDILVATYEELIEKGFFNPDTMSFNGVILEIEKVDFNNNNVLFVGSKYRSAKGAVGVEVTVHFKDKQWQPKEVKMTWMS